MTVRETYYSIVRITGALSITFDHFTRPTNKYRVYRSSRLVDGDGLDFVVPHQRTWVPSPVNPWSKDNSLYD